MKKKRWRKIVLSFLPILIVVIGLVFVSGVLMPGQRELPENVSDALKDTSVVMASYDIGDNMKGIIGVVGPTRMDYAKVTARLSYFADSLTRMFGKELPAGDQTDKEDP